jgi:hypothetical protein
VSRFAATNFASASRGRADCGPADFVRQTGFAWHWIADFSFGGQRWSGFKPNTVLQGFAIEEYRSEREVGGV